MIILLDMVVIAFLILFPADTAETARQALSLWANNIVPVLFPYMVLSKMLCHGLYAVHFPIVPFTAALGMLGGSPSGAAAIAANNRALSQRCRISLCALAGTISPMFILGSIQTWLVYPGIAHRLLLCHWLSAVLCACMVWLFHCDCQQEISFHADEINSATAGPLQQSIDAMFQIGGCVILYSVLAGMLGKILVSVPLVKPLVHAALEVSGGIHAICQSAFSLKTKSLLISAALGFSGFSILAQNYSLLKPLGIPMKCLILFGIIRASVSAAMMNLSFILVPLS